MALLNLNALNESLEKINESVMLQEKMSDTMPKWLADRILTDKYSNSDSTRDLHKASRWDKNPKTGPTPVFVNARDKGWSDKRNGGQGLYKRFFELGIDLSTVPVHETEVPTTPNTPLLKDENIIGIFLFDNGQVYATGVNEDEVCLFDERDRAFKITPKKTILGHCVAAAYIDLNEINTAALSNKRVNRTNQRSLGNLEIPLERGVPGARETVWNSNTSDYTRAFRDKSGYLPNPYKYADKLGKIRAGRYQESLNDFYNTLRSLKNSIAVSFTGSDVGEEETYGLLSQYADCAALYKRLCQRIENALNGSFADEKKRDMIADALATDGNDLKKQLNRLEENGNRIFDAVLEW